MKSKIFTIMATLVISALITAMAAPLFTTSATNCGGNNAARDDCHNFVLSAMIASEEKTGQFEIGKMEQQSVMFLARPHWGICGTNLLVKTNFSTSKVNNHNIVIVCTEPFGNIPQPTIWNFYHQTRAHAVGYSDGKIELISPAEFKSLNLNGFISISNLVAGTELAVTN